MKPSDALHLTLPLSVANRFTPLLGAGVGIVTETGISLIALLCDRLGINKEYVDERIQTIFINGRAVDQTEKVILEKNAVVALSAAMPGLVGATFRKQGMLAAFRKDISHRQEYHAQSKTEETIVTVKLFNLVAKELGPSVLHQGVLLKGYAATSLIEVITGLEALSKDSIRWNGEPADIGLLSAAVNPKDWIALQIAWQTE